MSLLIRLEVVGGVPVAAGLTADAAVAAGAGVILGAVWLLLVADQVVRLRLRKMTKLGMRQLRNNGNLMSYLRYSMKASVWAAVTLVTACPNARPSNTEGSYRL